jgi:type VI secretion system protein VasJ
MAGYDEAPIIEIGKTPISPDAPCGAECAEEEDYLAVMAEFGKFGRIGLEDEPDWFIVEDRGLDLLKNRTKDCALAVVVGHGLFERYSWQGLGAALGMITEMVRAFWADLFPQRERRRKARIESLTLWFADTMGDSNWMKENEPKNNDDFDGLDSCVKYVTELDTVLKEKMPDDAPDFAKFLRAVKGQAAKRPKAPEPVAAAPVAASTEGGAPAAAPSAAPAGAGFAAAAPTDVGGAQSAIMNAIAYIRKEDPAHPFPYAIARIAKWARIQLPTTDEAKYQIEPPDNQTIEALQHQMNNGLWDHLLKNAEAAFRAQDPFWLDLQRYVAAAMMGLGPPYDAARKAVMGETAVLVSRLGDGIYDLRFRTGTPLCSGETRMWIESEVLPKGEGGGGGGDGSARVTEAFEAARKLVASGKLKEGLQGLAEGLAASRQRRDQFLFKLRMAQLCADAQRIRLAAPILEECRAEATQYRIIEWEPQIVVDVARTLHKCRKALLASEKQPTPELIEDVAESYAWLCQVDPLAALEAEPADGK